MSENTSIESINFPYLRFRIQGEKLLSAFVPVDLIELVCLPHVLQRAQSQTKCFNLYYAHFYCVCIDSLAESSCFLSSSSNSNRRQRHSVGREMGG